MKALALIVALVAAQKRAAEAAPLTRRWLLRQDRQRQYREARAALLRHCLAHPVRAVA